MIQSRPSPVQSTPIEHPLHIRRSILSLTISALAVGFFLSGCAHTAPIMKSAANNTALRQADSVFLADSAPLPEIPICTRVADMIINAALLGGNHEFALANRILCEASSLIEDDQDLTQNETAKAQLYEQIANIYATVLPAAYADSTTDEIAVMLFQNQLDISLDSVQIGPADSAALSVISIQKKTTYDVPIICNGRVLRALHMLRTNQKGNFQKWLERGKFYLPAMRQMFIDSGMPGDLVYLALIESGFSPKATSRAKACGIWQFIGPTGDRYHLRRNYWLDERRDPLKSTAAAISYLKTLNNEFNDWYLSLSAYNCGEGGLRRNISGQGTDDYWQLTLPRETMNYVPQFIAAVLLAKNPASFGLQVGGSDSITINSLDTVSVSSCIDIEQLEKAMDLEESAIRTLNPHILQSCTPPDMSNVTLYLPPNTRDLFGAVASKLPPVEPIRWIHYRVRSRDNLKSIARTFKISVDDIKQLNRLKSSQLRAGQYLKLPGHGVKKAPSSETVLKETTKNAVFTDKNSGTLIRYRIRRGDRLENVARTFNVSVADLCKWNKMESSDAIKYGTILRIYQDPRTLKSDGSVDAPPQAEPRDPNPENSGTYVVQTGDNLSRIATRLGVSIGSLAKWNDLDLENAVIKPGQKLKIRQPEGTPGKSTSKTITKATTTKRLTYRVKSGDNLSSLANLFSVSIDDIADANDMSTGDALLAGTLIKIPINGDSKAEKRTMISYTVKQGDTVWDIARTFGISVELVYALNNIDRNRGLITGEALKIVTGNK